MFTVKELGTTYVLPFGGLTGWPTAIGSLNVGIVLLLPSVVKELIIQGSIIDGSKADWGDRPCYHFDAEGTVLLPQYSGAVTTTIVDPLYPESSGYRGSRLSVTKSSFKMSDGSTINQGGPIWVPGGQTFSMTYPDHQHLGVAWYRNIKQDISMVGSTLTETFTYDTSYTSAAGPWKTTVSKTVCYVDLVNKKYSYTSASGPWTKIRVLGNFGTKNPSIIHAPLRIKEWADAYHRVKFWFEPVNDSWVFGDLCRRCANDARGIDTNGIALVHELANLSNSLKDTYHLIKGKKTLKNVSSLFLSYKYGTRLTVADIQKIVRERVHIIKSFSQEKSWVRSSNGITGKSLLSTPMSRYTFYTYKIVYHRADDAARKFISDWIDSGLFPSLENAWDLIPYSFVVDWAADVQSSVQQYDASTYWSVHSIIGATGSSKDVFSGVQPMVLFPWLANCIGQLEFKRYRRFTSTTLETPFYFDDSPQDFKNFAELTALILQKVSKR